MPEQAQMKSGQFGEKPKRDEAKRNRVFFRKANMIHTKRPRNSKAGKAQENAGRQEQRLKMSGGTWLRMNAGGMPNTCKSNEALYYEFFGMTIW